MKHSEFWRSLEIVFGPAHGRSLASDLVLSAIGGTCEQALAAGRAPQEVWRALCDEMRVADADRWVHRDDPGRRRR